MGKNIAILIVDDEVNILKALNRCLMDEPYDIIFATSPKEALDILEEEEIDIIITDYKMPEMSGAELLIKVKEKFPSVFRIILSGYIDQNVVHNLLINGTAMLFFPKPWSDYDILKKLKVVIKTVKILKSRRLVDFFQSIDLSACTMDIYNKLIEAIEHDLSIKGIADIIKQDVALATKIMQLGNSIFYGPSECTSLEQAIVKLGLNTVKNISLLYSVSSCANLNKVQQHWLSELTKDAAITALCMEKMCALSINKLDIDTASTIGVLKNIGRNILIAYKPEYYKQLLNILESNPDIDAFEAESLSESTLPTHAEISGYYLMTLNLPFVIVESILYHHTPEKASESSQVYAKMLYIADKIIEPNMRKYNVFSLKLPEWVQEIISLEDLEKLKNEVEKYYEL